MKKFSLLMTMMLMAIGLSAQNIRYVKTDGAYSNDGLSWENAKNNIQDAINDLVNNKLEGEVWVAAGTYTPTESTESSGGSTLYMSFKIPAGITIRGGFRGQIKDGGGNVTYAGETNPDERETQDFNSIGWFYKHHTILSGDLTTKPDFAWDSKKEQWNPTFYGNSYHVVWFAMNGFDANGRANGLDKPAVVEGFVIQDGHAYNNSLNERHHNAYGGGAYMVANSTMQNCYFRNCDASRDGGAVYMDGGGMLIHSYISDSQALGIGVDHGYGGGVCMEGSDKPGVHPIIVTGSGITNCVGRMGGGIATKVDKKCLNWRDNVAINATLVNNNTATTEGGGVYMLNGGAIANATIVRNKCNGTGVTSKGMITGRAGGLYARDNASIANTVIWGNKCDANRDVQYAASRSSASASLKPIFYYNSINKSDYTDWSGTVKKGIQSLADDNEGTVDVNNGQGFPIFRAPTAIAGAGQTENISESSVNHDIDHDGNITSTKYTLTMGMLNLLKYSWKVSAESALHHAGINTYDITKTLPDKGSLVPEVSTDITGERYNPRSTQGAYTAAEVNIRFWQDGSTANFFVDPNYLFGEHSNDAKGVSWDAPTRFLANVFEYIVAERKKTGNGDLNGITTINIYVKEGTVDNTDSYRTGRVREMAIEVPSGVNVYGSYAKDLGDRDISKRNPVLTPTIISGELFEDYQYYVSHLISINNASNILLDGFKLTFANAESTELENNSVQNGAAITLKDSNTGIEFKNLTVSNCKALRGPAVYADNSTASFENCIFHNNTAFTANDVNGAPHPVSDTYADRGVIFAQNGSHLTFDHCNTLRNVGYASYLDGSSSNEWNNSMFYGNLDRVQDNTNDTESYAIVAFSGDGAKKLAASVGLSGTHNMFDDKTHNSTMWDDAKFGPICADVPNAPEYNTNSLNYTYEAGVPNGYPRMVNPTKNAGVSEYGDVTFYGRSTSFEPHNDNPVLNRASVAGTHDTWGKDITIASRDFGGLPDIGAVESRYAYLEGDNDNANADGQRAYGETYYVRDYRDGGGNIDYTSGGDGMSWENAINGNAYYYEDGTHGSNKTKTFETGEQVWRPGVTTYQRGSSTNIPTTNGAQITVVMQNGSNYLVLDRGSLSTTTDIAGATEFTITCTRSGNFITGYTYSYTIKAGTVNLGYTSTNGSAAFSTSSGNYTWYQGASTSSPGTTSSVTFANKTGNSNRRWLGTNGLANNSVTWNLYQRNSSTTEGYWEEITGTYTGVIGLQYAVNSAHNKFHEEGGSEAQKKEVWVGTGAYTNATAADGDNTVQQPYAYMIKEGVDVYGGFPGTGNPGMDQRNPKKYETILQPQTQSPYVTLGTHHKYSGSYEGYTPTNWGANANATDGQEQASVGRVLVQPSDFTVETKWDGFTMRHGYLLTARMKNIGEALSNLITANLKTAGGAGALLQEKGHLANCVVKENLLLCYPNSSRMTKTGDDVNTTIRGTKSGVTHSNLYTYHLAGAGIFMTGSTNGAVVENCELAKNQILTKGYNRDGSVPDNIWMYGGGIFQDNGNVYNTTIHDNDAATIKGSDWTNSASGDRDNNEMILGAGAFIADGNCFNNTIVNNMSATIYWCHNNHCTFAGVHVKDKAKIYNTIVADNESHWGYQNYGSGTDPGNGVPVSAFQNGATGRDSRDQTKVHVTYSYVDVNAGTANVDLISYHDDQKDPSYDYGTTRKSTNIYINRNQFTTSTTANQNPASLIYYQNGASGTTAENIYHLKSNSPAINAGTIDIPGVTIPDYDAAYDERILDCGIDIGAYEYNGSYEITPDVTSVSGQAIYYVTPQGVGVASAASPSKAACAEKLQKVLDAAGRYKYQNKNKQVIVKVANDYALQHPVSGLDEDKEDFQYFATRTTDQTSTDTRMWSIIIPRGVEVWGGYTDATASLTFGNVTDNAGENGFWRAATAADVTAGLAANVGDKVDARDVVNNPTYFASSFYNREMKINAVTYHIVTFTDRLFDGLGRPYMAGDESRMTNNQNSTFVGNSSGAITDDMCLLMTNSLTDKDVTTAGGKTFSARAVLDGIFVTGGQADGKDFSGTNAHKNANGYGGAAIVTDYAHVRNCIFTGNRATYGGALALKDQALVSGSLFVENNADKHGGALYVFEEGVSLSDGTTINTGTHEETAPVGMTSMDQYMPHVYTSTIVGNHAKQGGGVWFTEDETPNVRFNSTVIWNNTADDQANVAGTISPNKPENDTRSVFEFYPFAYSAVQNLRMSGVNNLSVDNQNKKGVRFATRATDFDPDWEARKPANDDSDDEDEKEIHPLYGLSSYSVLLGKGMPKDDYTALIRKYALVQNDFAAVDRFINSSKIDRNYVEIGARAFDKVWRQNQLMLRLFVAQAEDIDVDAAETLMNPDLSTGTEAEKKLKQYYSQEGSSFAYPFQDLQAALDYIYMVRKDNTEGGFLKTYQTNNLPFEIYVAKGTYTPSRDLAGHYGQSLANTFAIPEGVSIIGGYPVDGPEANTFYGAGYRPKEISAGNYASQAFTAPTQIEKDGKFISANVEEITGADPQIGGYKLKQLPMSEMLSVRKRTDINGNQVIEPWEFENQTILSGDAISAENAGVYHVVTAIADQNVVGMLPKISWLHADHSGSCTGYEDHEEGQTIHLNGITVTGGYAHHYVPGSLDKYGKFVFYQGGGVLVDGNRYNDNYNKNDSHPAWVTGDAEFNETHKTAYAVGYRDIPLSVSNCKFLNNQAGYGGAIASNGTVDIFASSFEQNLALQKDETVTEYDEEKGRDVTSTIQYPGLGGAIHATHQLSAFNTLFANNEASSNTYRDDPHLHKSFRVQDPENAGGVPVQDGAGGAIMVGTAGLFHIVNCDFVHNKANMYPAIFTLNPDKHPLQDPDADANGRKMIAQSAYLRAIAGGADEDDALSAAETASTNASTEVAKGAYFQNIQTPQYSQAINSVFWGNEVHPTMLSKYGSNKTFMTASKLAVNVGLKGRVGAYNSTFNKENAPTPSYNSHDLDNSGSDDCRFQEMMWFCAYEEGCGFTPNNDHDCRNIDYKPFGHAFYQVGSYLQSEYGLANAYQNANILLDSDNESLEGPNFVRPSLEAGVDGWDEGADWAPARLNNLTDAGSGRIEQIIQADGESYSSQFVKYGDEKQGGGTWTVPDDGRNDLYSSEQLGDYVTSGAYTMTHYLKDYPEYNAYLSLGNEYYMESAYTLDEKITVDGKQYDHQQLLRISYDPNPTHKQTYIDIGVYEYPHTELKYHTEGDEVDILWVSSAEKPDNGLPDGSDWTQPTSDLQRAIETLLASRNGHRKEIRLMDGTFTPIYTIENNLSFYFDTKYQNESVMLPPVLDSNGDPTGEVYENLGITSFTIKGGYSRNLFGQYDVDEYPAIIKSQKRTDTGNHWDHLFYIKDMTQRYGSKTGYGDSNNYGAGAEVKTIPLEIDGVTFVNDQSSTGAKGAAIFYDDTDAIGVTPAKISRITYYEDEGKTVVSETPTKFFTREECTNPEDGFSYVQNDKPAKFIMSKCTVYGSGTGNAGYFTLSPETSASAVHIGTGAGHTLFFNNVFHSNYGKPLVANNAVTVNNTFALNGRYVDLKNETADGTGSWPKSSIKNSVLWNNNWNIYSSQYDQQFKLDGYTSDNASGAIFARNAYNDADCEETDYETSDEMAAANYNVNLVPDNGDVIYGPNFTDPDNADLSKRSFIPMPSLRLLNKGDKTMYNDAVSKPGVADNYYSGGGHDINPAANIYDMAWLTTTQHDAASAPRIVNEYIDLGAYEYQNQLDRVYYVDPNKTMAGAGTSWESPFSLGMIQAAIDLAGVYVVNHLGEDANSRQAYVFVKGASATNAGLHTNEAITLRNGVMVYGSIGSDYAKKAKRSTLPDDDPEKATEEQHNFDEFVADMLAQREGVASNAASKTTVLGIKTEGTGFTKGVHDDGVQTLIDGFDVYNPSATTEPIISINPDKEEGAQDGELSICLKDIIVRDNNVTGANVAEINNALLYEVLMRDNTVDGSHAVLKVKENGYLVHGTIEGKTEGADGSKTLNGHGDASTPEAIATAESASQVMHSLVNYAGDAATKNTLSGYNYPLEDKNLNYQLAEMSKHIDAIEPQVPAALPNALEGFIDYDHDRDILGNPRYLQLAFDGSSRATTLVDRGAFETWKVENDFVCGENGTVNRTTKDIAKQHYPHDGSVVYVMEGKSLVIDPFDPEHEIKATAHNPGFMLLKEGASCYGNGRPMTVAYLAVERTAKSEGNVISMPFAMDYVNDVKVPSYDANGVLSLANPSNASVYTYNGAARADWQYNFRNANSPCWENCTAKVAANSGVLYVPGDEYPGIAGPEDNKKVLRFTAKGASMTDYIYTETTDPYKTVTLTQYNDGGRDTHENGNTDDNADFTDNNDMGWNAIGLPYLVSQYKTYETITNAMATGSYGYDDETKGQVVGKYMMHTPKTLWMFYDGQTYEDGSHKADGDGGFYSVSSWDGSEWNLGVDETARIWVGEGFFTQTATLSDTETLTFYRPVYTPAPVADPDPARSSVDDGAYNSRYYVTTDVRPAMDEDFTGKQIVATRYYTADGVQHARPVRGVTIQVDIYDDGSRQTRKFSKR